MGPGRWECELCVDIFSLSDRLFILTRNSGRPNGITFAAPASTSVFLKRTPLKEGDIVSFKHHGFLLKTLKPKLPTLYRKREDLTWENVVSNWKEQKKTRPLSECDSHFFCY